MEHKEKIKLLLVDDIPTNLVALEALIERDDAEIYKANSGVEALEMLLHHEFALAIVDVHMPGMDGFELAELMRCTERTKQVPIVFVSAGGQDLNYAFKGYESGAVDFLPKPLDTQAVRTKVNVFFELYQQKRTLKQQLQALEKIRLEQESLLAELQKTQAELHAAIRMRDDFLSIAAHELRTPLSVLRLQLQIRQKQLEKGDLSRFTPDRLPKLFEQDDRLVTILFRQINEMVDIARIRAGTLYLEPSEFELGEMVREVANQFGEQMASVGCSLHLDIAATLLGCWDRFRLEQVLINLLTNAMRYAPGTPIHLSLSRAGQRARLSVRDGGPGIAPEYHERIFQQFERAALPNRDNGLGLGLYIAREIVEGHGGRIWVESSQGQGANFVIELPLDLACVKNGTDR
ncbi:hybrid sensor histidine kinase/response regulator [Chitinimonas lacunae]|uniref:histidine kinase n=1 Tax=Chitinimonas lacunae TaxID=1963018 RepID=A0ABV8MM85_9NEIS